MEPCESHHEANDDNATTAVRFCRESDSRNDCETIHGGDDNDYRIITNIVQGNNNGSDERPWRARAIDNVPYYGKNDLIGENGTYYRINHHGDGPNQDFLDENDTVLHGSFCFYINRIFHGNDNEQKNNNVPNGKKDHNGNTNSNDNSSHGGILKTSHHYSASYMMKYVIEHNDKILLYSFKMWIQLKV